MQKLIEIPRWRQGISPDAVEPRVRWLQDQIAAAERALEAQQRIISHDGLLDAYKLSLDSLKDSQRRQQNELATLMESREIEVLDFALAGPRYDGHRARAGVLAKFLHAMQQLYERVGQAMGTGRPTAVIPKNILALCQLDVAGFYPSSFGVRFVAPTRSEMDGFSLTTTALEATFDLVNADQPLEEAARVGKWALAKYRHLVSTMVDAEAVPKVSWKTPTGAERQWAIDDNRLLVLHNRLANIKDSEPKIKEARGTLMGASLRRQRFEFSDGSTFITGAAPKELAAKVTAHFGKACRITYVETVFIDETTDQEKHSRTLVDITAV
jgi:hypothetical protein